MTFDPKWPHGHTVGGAPAKIVFTTPRGSHLVVVNPEADSHSEWFTPEGTQLGARDSWRLVNAPAPKRKVKVDHWITVANNPGRSSLGNYVGPSAGRWADAVAVHIIGEIEEGAEVTLTLPARSAET